MRRRWGSGEKIITPPSAFLPNIGEAHSEGFSEPGEKEAEENTVCQGDQRLIYCNYQPETVGQRE